METVQYHLYDVIRGMRLATFYDRRNLRDFIPMMFPLGTIPPIAIQCDDGETVATLCSVNDVMIKGGEWLMCL